MSPRHAKPLSEHYDAGSLEGSCWIAHDAELRLKRHGEVQSLARVVFEAERGRVPAGFALLRRCGSRGCVNPEHRSLAKRRASSRIRRLSRDEVRRLKILYDEGWRQVDLVRMFDLSPAAVHHIVHGRRRDV